MRLRAINTRGCVLQTAFLGLSNRLRPRRCVPIRSHRRDITRARSFESRLVYMCITRAMHSQVYRGKATRTVRRRWWRRETDLSGPHRLLLPSFFFFCRNESTVGIPLSLSFRWSVRSLILACTPRASQGHSWEGGRNVQTETKKRRQTRQNRRNIEERACM